jgi:hypothetical protein
MVRTYDGEKEMKIRTNRRRVQARLAHNNRTNWLLAPILARAKVTAERNQRIKALVDKAFPEFAK